MPRLLALVLALLFWPQPAGERARAAIVEASASERACVVAARGSTIDAPGLGAERVVLESEPDRTSRRTEGRHAPPCAPFRTALLLASTGEHLAGNDASRRQRPTTSVYFATAPPRGAPPVTS